jgi:hypothetical protein
MAGRISRIVAACVREAVELVAGFAFEVSTSGISFAIRSSRGVESGGPAAEDTVRRSYRARSHPSPQGVVLSRHLSEISTFVVCLSARDRQIDGRARSINFTKSQSPFLFIQCPSVTLSEQLICDGRGKRPLAPVMQAWSTMHSACWEGIEGSKGDDAGEKHIF